MTPKQQYERQITDALAITLIAWVLAGLILYTCASQCGCSGAPFTSAAPDTIDAGLDHPDASRPDASRPDALPPPDLLDGASMIVDPTRMLDSSSPVDLDATPSPEASPPSPEASPACPSSLVAPPSFCGNTYANDPTRFYLKEYTDLDACDWIAIPADCSANSDTCAPQCSCLVELQLDPKSCSCETTKQGLAIIGCP